MTKYNSTPIFNGPLTSSCFRMSAAALCIAFAIAAASAKPEPFTCEGYFEQIFVHKPETPVLEDSFKFRVERDSGTNAWRIDDFTHPPRAAFQFQDFLVNRTATTGVVTTNLHVSSYSDTYPADLESDQRLLWFVYCAGDYLRRQEGKLVFIPHGDVRSDFHVASCRGKADWRSDNDVCPENMEFFVDRDLLKKSADYLSLERPGSFLNDRQKSFEFLLQTLTNGQVMARFQVTGWTNIGITGIPQRWTLQTFSARGQLARIFEGRTDAVTAISQAESPLLPEIARITDKRVRDVKRGLNFVSYGISDGQIPEVTSPQIAALVIRATSDHNMPMPPDLRKPTIIFITAIALLLIAPVFAMLISKHRRSKTSS